MIDFQRIALTPGESKEVRFDIPIEQLYTVQEDGSSKLVRGEYTFTVASAAPSKRNEALGVNVLTANAKIK